MSPSDKLKFTLIMAAAATAFTFWRPVLRWVGTWFE